MATIGVVANVFNEASALPGWLESATAWADWVGVMHAGPQGSRSDDGTLELLERWRVPVQFCAIDEGFGAVRTRTLRMCPPNIDWVVLLDADERFHQLSPVMTCSGESTPADVVDDLLYDYGNPNYHKDGPRNMAFRTLSDKRPRQVVQGYDSQIDFGACPSNFENLALLGANLQVKVGGVYDHVERLKQILRMDVSDQTNLDAVKVVRRHWHDFTHRRPTQNWHTDPDYQMRILRNHPSIYFAQDTRMHERVVGVKRIYIPDFTYGPFFEHFHLFMKKLEVRQRAHDLAIYNAVDRGEVPPTWEEFKK